MTTTPPPGDPVWEGIRSRYEAGTEQVKTIAGDVGLSGIRLSVLALKQGWKMRGLRKSKKKKDGAKHLPPTTRETILRLKDMLQQRVAQLEQELRDIGAEVDGLGTERQIKSVNTLVRTLEKVLDLERKDKLKRKQATRDFKYFDDAQRHELAQKIDRLEETRDGSASVADAGLAGGDGTEQPVALLGEAGPATAAGGE